MPALRGSLTYARFFVDGDLGSGFHDRFLRAIRLRAMKPLEPQDEDLERSGWCRVGEPFETELGHEDVFYNEFVNLGFRTDKWVIPGPLLRAKMREAEAAYLAKRGREKLSRSEKSELKDAVSRKLRRHLDPRMRAFDVSWALNEGIVRFFCHAAKPGLAMSDLFEKTFGLKLVPEAPYTLATRIGMKKTEEKAWEEIEATSFLTGEVG